MKKIYINKEEVEKYILEGKKIAEMAEIFRVSKPTMQKFLRENNLKTQIALHRDKLKLLPEKEIISLYLSGQSMTDISIKYGCSNIVIKRILDDYHIEIRTNSKAHQKWSANYKYFNKIDNMNKAYLLGFICADGWITDANVLGIEVKSSDRALIDFFQKQLETEKPIIDKGKSVNLTLQDKQMCDKIKEYSILPRKSLNLNLSDVIKLSNLTEEQTKAFLLGYFDGDGGIYEQKTNNYYQYSFSITGTIETCQYYRQYFDNIGFLTKRHLDDKNNYTYQVGGKNQVNRALSKLYSIKDQLTFYYERKFLIYSKTQK